jgi:hypothetical protein
LLTLLNPGSALAGRSTEPNQILEQCSQAICV